MRHPLLSSVLIGLALSVAGAVATSPAGATTVAAPTRASYTTLTTFQFESRLLSKINYRRQAHGCRLVRLNASLLLAARRHSARMSDQSTLSHRLAGEADLVGRVESAGYLGWRLLAENLAWGQATPRGVFRAWVNSPGHRANLDNCRLREIGVGVVYRSGRPWVTADFGRRL